MCVCARVLVHVCERERGREREYLFIKIGYIVAICTTKT